MTTATRSRKQKNAENVTETHDTETVGQQSSNETLSIDAQQLSERLEGFGFEVPTSVITAWDTKAIHNIARVVASWEEDYQKHDTSEAIPEVARMGIPPLLRPYEEFNQGRVDKAHAMAKDAADAGRSVNSNPFPPKSLLATYWIGAFGVTQPPAIETVEPSVELKDARARTDRARDQALAIEAAQDRMEAAINSQTELKREFDGLKSQMKSVKADYDDAVLEAQEAGRELREARAGILPTQRSLPFPADSGSMEIPDFGSIELDPDHGAAKDLNCLKRKTIQDETGCSEDVGLTAKQIETLKEQIGGTTIGALEKFQRETFNWEQAIKGFGEEKITLLSNAHLEIRKKFPMPTANDSIDSAPSFDLDESIARLDRLIRRATDIAEDCDSEAGAEHCYSVGDDAVKMRTNITEAGKVSSRQSDAILNWEKSVEKWAPKVDPLEEDLD